MKTLRLLRHAKSSWDDHNLTDIERPLNKRGMRDAPRMAERLCNKPDLPQVIISSPALRAITTARIMAETIGLADDKLKPLQAIYSGGVSPLIEIIQNLNDDWDSAMLVGHNPCFTYLANDLTIDKIDHIPTAGLVTIKFALEKWQEISSGIGELIDFDYPNKA